MTPNGTARADVVAAQRWANYRRREGTPLPAAITRLRAAWAKSQVGSAPTRDAVEQLQALERAVTDVYQS